MRVERERQFKANCQAAEDEATRMEEERQSVAIEAEIQSTSVELACQISDWLQITFRFISNW